MNERWKGVDRFTAEEATLIILELDGCFETLRAFQEYTTDRFGGSPVTELPALEHPDQRQRNRIIELSTTKLIHLQEKSKEIAKALSSKLTLEEIKKYCIDNDLEPNCFQDEELGKREKQTIYSIIGSLALALSETNQELKENSEPLVGYSRSTGDSGIIGLLKTKEFSKLSSSALEKHLRIGINTLKEK